MNLRESWMLSMMKIQVKRKFQIQDFTTIEPELYFIKSPK